MSIPSLPYHLQPLHGLLPSGASPVQPLLHAMLIDVCQASLLCQSCLLVLGLFVITCSPLLVSQTSCHPRWCLLPLSILSSCCTATLAQPFFLPARCLTSTLACQSGFGRVPMVLSTVGSMAEPPHGKTNNGTTGVASHSHHLLVCLSPSHLRAVCEMIQGSLLMGN